MLRRIRDVRPLNLIEACDRSSPGSGVTDKSGSIRNLAKASGIFKSGKLSTDEIELELCCRIPWNPRKFRAWVQEKIKDDNIDDTTSSRLPLSSAFVPRIEPANARHAHTCAEEKQTRIHYDMVVALLQHFLHDPCPAAPAFVTPKDQPRNGRAQ